MKKIIGVDVSKNFIIAFDGKSHWKITLKDIHIIERITDKNTIVVMEQTGAYGLKFAQLFTKHGATVYFADGKRFKRFRIGKKTKKSDYIDAMYLRKFFFEFPKWCYPYDMKKHHMRAIVRQHIRNNKDLTKHANRLKQYLAIVFPEKDYYEMRQKTLYKYLDQIEQELKTCLHHYRDLALLELEKYRLAYQSKEYTEKELKNFARNCEDWEILKTFPNMGEITAAVLIAYYQDIRKFSNIDAFVGYMLSGVEYEQSGQIEKHKPDRARTEIKALLFNVYNQSRRKKSVLRPLIELVHQLKSGNKKHDHNLRVIKFIDFYLRIIWYALKYRVDFETALRMRIHNIARAYIREEKTNPFKANEIRRSLLAHVQVLVNYKSSENHDISLSCESGTESINLISELFNHFINLAKVEEEKNEDKNPDQNRNITGDNRKLKSQIPEPDPENDPGHNNDVPPYLKRKGFDGRSNRTPETLRDIYPQTQENQEDEIPY